MYAKWGLTSAPVAVRMRGGLAPRRAATGWLDEDDLGAEISQNPPGLSQ